MGAAHSHEDLEICTSDEEEYEEYEERRDDGEEEDKFEDSRDDTLDPSSSGGRRLLRPKPPSSSLDDVDAKLRALKLKYTSTTTPPPSSTQNSARLFRYINGNTPKANGSPPRNPPLTAS
ncbi:hypothetical protein Rs2_08407 [Raphanus sativus]|nr:hypothetical protein Rs2_08407 [Raphanus sativus]